MVTQGIKVPTRAKPFTIRLSEDEKARLVVYAAKNDLRIAQVLRRVIRESLPAATGSDDAAGAA